MADMQRFYRKVAEAVEECREDGGSIDYLWLQDRIYNEDHPRYGPPIPPELSDLGHFDRMLREVYAPGLDAQINSTRSLFWTNAR